MRSQKRANEDCCCFVAIFTDVTSQTQPNHLIQTRKRRSMMMTLRTTALLLLLLATIQAFAPIRTTSRRVGTISWADTNLFAVDADKADQNEIIARRIVVEGDVQGGYYRSCVLNEAGRFRRLVGTMSPPDDSRKAEIYVEGKKKLVLGFINWCKKGNVGLSQMTSVIDVVEEDPTGLYDEFYVKTH